MSTRDSDKPDEKSRVDPVDRKVLDEPGRAKSEADATEMPKDPVFAAQLARAQEIAARLAAQAGVPHPGDKRPRPDTFEKPSSAKRMHETQQREKIMLPLDRHPGVNFLGGIVGPNGSTQKRLEEQSGCRIFVRGRGASKPEAPDAHEPMHVLVVGDSREQLENAKKLVDEIIQRKIADGPPTGDWSRSLERREGTHASPYGPSGGSDAPESKTVKIKVPSAHVGYVIGKGGETIMKIQDASHARVQVQRDSEADPGAAEREVSISGNPEEIRTAQEMIQKLIVEKETGRIGGMVESTIDAARQSSQPTKVIMIPNRCVGMVIGRRGETINELQQRSGARVQMGKDYETTATAERPVTISGTPESIAMAEELIGQKISDDRDAPPSYAQQKPSSSVYPQISYAQQEAQQPQYTPEQIEAYYQWYYAQAAAAQQQQQNPEAGEQPVPPSGEKLKE